ncbi:chitinase 10-like 2 [Homarus americanus]|uniref:Chitinase 10-like 2 n=1 Tax=Homarus americanus TaxID=6706 RepID=A0A8J5JUD2_HOMAM|nr:chitinase 10-like 2 [Homarus americanus]
MMMAVMVVTCGPGGVVQYQLLCAMWASKQGVTTFGNTDDVSESGVECALAKHDTPATPTLLTPTLLTTNDSAHTVWIAQSPPDEAATTPPITATTATPAITTTVPATTATPPATTTMRLATTTVHTITTTAVATTTTANPTTTTTIPSGGVCHAVQGSCDTVGEFFIHPTDCAKYLRCSTTNKLEEHPCGSGTHWSQSKLTCDMIASVIEPCRC